MVMDSSSNASPRMYTNHPQDLEMGDYRGIPNTSDAVPFEIDIGDNNEEGMVREPTEGDAYMAVSQPKSEVVVRKDLDKSTMYYEIEDVPSPLAAVFLSLQVYLMMAGTALSGPYILTEKMCMANDDPAKAKVVATFMLVAGVVTILQSSFGTRLPIVQGGSAAFLVASLAILERWDCPTEAEYLAKPGRRTEIWQERMRVIQGAIICASLFQVIFGFCGFVGLILRYITPLTVAPSIMMIGLSLFGIAAGPVMSNFAISFPTIVLIVILSQYFRECKIPIPFTKSPKRNGRLTYKVFQSLPILLGMAIMWIFCAILTASNAISKENPASTNLTIFYRSDAFYVPYPFQWGTPEVRAGPVLGILAGVIAGIIESIGDYFACARLVGAKAPSLHAINRGIFIEGIGCIVAGIWGSGSGTTSYSENTGSIGVTQVGSRRVIQIGGVIMVVMSIFGKVNALFVSIPEPIVGAFLVVAFSMITSVGILNLKGVDLSSARNLFVIGFSVFFSLTLSQWIKGHKKLLLVENETFNQMLIILLSTGMFLGGLVGFILDNTIPGTRKERGLDEWEENFGNAKPTPGNVEDSYDLPFVTFYLQKYEFTKWIPISPTYDQDKYSQLFAPLRNAISIPFRVVGELMTPCMNTICCTNSTDSST